MSQWTSIACILLRIIIILGKTADGKGDTFPEGDTSAKEEKASKKDVVGMFSVDNVMLMIV